MTALCVKPTNRKNSSDFAIQSTSVSSVHSSNLKQSFANGQINKDNFKILKVIGRGSFGKVFLVEKKPTTDFTTGETGKG